MSHIDYFNEYLLYKDKGLKEKANMPLLIMKKKKHGL